MKQETPIGYDFYFGARLANNIRFTADTALTLVDQALRVANPAWHFITSTPIMFALLPALRTATLSSFLFSMIRKSYQEEKNKAETPFSKKYENTIFYSVIVTIFLTLFLASTISSILLSSTVGIGFYLGLLVFDSGLELFGINKRQIAVKNLMAENKTLDEEIHALEMRAPLLSDAEKQKLQLLINLKNDNQGLIETLKKQNKFQYAYLINNAVMASGASLLIPATVMIGPALAASIALPPVGAALLIAGSTLLFSTALFSTVHTLLRKKLDLKQHSLEKSAAKAHSQQALFNASLSETSETIPDSMLRTSFKLRGSENLEVDYAKNEVRDSEQEAHAKSSHTTASPNHTPYFFARSDSAPDLVTKPLLAAVDGSEVTTHAHYQ